MISSERLEIIQQCAQNLASSDWIPGYSTEDIRQEAIIIGIKGASKYNGSIPFDKFIANHMRHRLRSLRREKYIKPGCDCGKCLKCSNNSARVNIMLATEIPEKDESKSIQYEVYDTVEYNELVDYLDHSIPSDLRDDYLKLLAGVPINSARKTKIKNVIKSLLNDKA